MDCRRLGVVDREPVVEEVSWDTVDTQVSGGTVDSDFGFDLDAVEEVEEYGRSGRGTVDSEDVSGRRRRRPPRQPRPVADGVDGALLPGGL